MEYNNNISLLNPYELLGIKLEKFKNVPKKNVVSLLKKNYYNLALLCHPDRGGNKNDMNIITLAYKYIKEQVEDINDISYDTMEENFQNFCKDQENEKPLNFGEIYEETNDWIVNFNKEFEKNKEITLKNNDLFINGYGEFMEESEYSLSKNLNEDIKYNPDISIDIKKEGGSKSESKKKSKFTRELVEYKEPLCLPDCISNYHFDIDKIDDYSELGGNLKMCDYKLSLSEDSNGKNNLEEELSDYQKEITDYPKEEIEYKI